MHFAFPFDGIRQKFTGYQKDTETGLDFAEARMYENRHARFTAVDPLLASGKSGNPQTFNRYVYVLNSPLIFTDPTGLQTGFWYQPREGEGKAQYIQNGDAVPDNYERITRTDDNGNLIADLPEHLRCQQGGYCRPDRPDFVVMFNRLGPRTPTPQINVNTGQQSLEKISEYERNGWQIIYTKDWNYNHPQTGAVYTAITPLDVTLFRISFGVRSVSGAAITRGSSSTFAATNEQIIARASTFGAKRVTDPRPWVAGTMSHSRATAFVNRYQRLFGNRGLETNFYVPGPNGRLGSSTFDVFDKSKSVVYDFKFGNPIMKNSQFNKYTNAVEGVQIKIVDRFGNIFNRNPAN